MSGRAVASSPDVAGAKVEDPALAPTPNEQCRRFLELGMTPGLRVLDVGCGDGSVMVRLAERGCRVQGVEIDPALVARCRAAGLDVLLGRAERLPVPDESFDAIVCSVVVPYTDERVAVAEWSRVLKPGGFVNVTGHGTGYGIDYLFRGEHWKRRFYGFRMLVNTAVYGATGRRIPGFLGDTLCQTPRRMRAYYREHGLELRRELLAGMVAGHPQFICHQVVKPAAAGVG